MSNLSTQYSSSDTSLLDQASHDWRGTGWTESSARQSTKQRRNSQINLAETVSVNIAQFRQGALSNPDMRDYLLVTSIQDKKS